MSHTETETDAMVYAAASSVARSPLLTLVHHDNRAGLGRRLALRGRKMLGRGCDLIAEGAFDDAKLSRKHCEVVRQGDEVTVTDLGSRNGTFVNGERLSAAWRLQDGDVISLGRQLLLFHHGAPFVTQRKRDERICGVSEALVSLDRQLADIAPRDVTVLVQGETGVGKELVAREVHEQSGRSGRFVALNCSAVAGGVLNSELFGHRKGAFSGAERDREGLVAAATGGTLFLDEIGDASPEFQAALLRLLEQREYRPLGSDQVRTTDARFVAATCAPLQEAGGFRQDLLGRLAQWVIVVPPLRERREDIVPIALALAEREVGAEATLSRRFVVALLRHHWPRNVRELAAVITRAAIEAGDQSELDLTAGVADLLTSVAGPRLAPEPSKPGRRTQEQPDREELVALFIEQKGNMRGLAKTLGVGRSTLYRWIAAVGLTVDALRAELTRHRVEP